MIKFERSKFSTFFCISFVLAACFIIVYFEDNVYPVKQLAYWSNDTHTWHSQLRNSSFWTTLLVRSTTTTKSDLEICKLPDQITYKLTENVTSLEVLNKTAIGLVHPGGGFEPKNCRPRYSVAIIIPYRNRSQHREILLNHLHNFLQRQMIKYDIYLIEPVLPITFNRGLLCNIGFTEAISRHNYTCLIFHDVDQLPLNSANRYVCDINARHLATESSKNKFKIPYFAYIGGVVAIQRDFFTQLNGFSNLFFGWGGEDDDLLMRIQILNKRQGIARPAKGVGRYIALPHDRDTLNPENPHKFKLYKTSKTRFRKEGLNTLNYTVLATRLEPLYTWIHVVYNESQIKQEFETKWNAKLA